jgi:F420-dependent oxidoreductase-like protein
MRVALMIEGQMGLTYREILAIAQRAEAVGFEAFFRSDHYESFPGPPGRPTTDAWATLAGLARETSRIRLGVLVSPVTFRRPGNLAKLATTVDEMSDGRLEVGVGAGWHEAEHRRHGFPFPPIDERAELLEETLQVLHGLWTGPQGWSFHGRHVTIEDARFSPRPVQQPHPPIIVGGEGTPRSFRLAARYADEFNLSSQGPEEAAVRFARLNETCQSLGRDPGTLVHSAMVGTVVGRTPAELEERVATLLAEVAGEGDPRAWLDRRRSRWILGTPNEARAMAARFAAAGVQRLILPDFLPRDLEMVDLLAEALLQPLPSV